jgi:uncharacterized protein YqjF (DUF2071 family)
MEHHDFDRSILDDVHHRPWPMPDAPWVLTQSWHDLLFAHWPVDKVALAAKIPSSLELDLHDGEAWVGIVPFHMSNVAPRGVPSMPGVSAFPELNVRTYVRADGKPGVYFFSLDAGSALAVAAARTMFHLPYYNASIEVEQQQDGIRYRSQRSDADRSQAELVVSYRPAGPVFHPAEGTLEYFLTERYCLYTTDREARPLRVDVHHRRWPLHPAEATFERNTMVDPVGIRLTSRTPLLHFARRQDVVAWLPAPVRR